MERKYADLQEQLNQEMRQGHKACLRLNGLIRKLNSLKAFVQAKKEDAKSQLEEYVNKLSECLLEFRSEMLVQLDGAHRDKLVEIGELREGYEMDINTFSRLFEEAEKYVQFDRRFRLDDSRNIQKLLVALRQLLADQPDDKEMTDILHLEFKPSITLASIGPSLFGNVEKAVCKSVTTQDTKIAAEKPTKSSLAVEDKQNQEQALTRALQITVEKHRPRSTEPSVEIKGNQARVEAKDVQTQTEMLQPEILQQGLGMLQVPSYPTVNLQQHLGVNYKQQHVVNLQQHLGVNYKQQPVVNLQQPPGLNYQQQCSAYGQAPTVLYPCVTPVYSPPGFAGNSPLLYGTRLQISPLQSPPCFQGSTNVEKVVRRARKKISITKTKSPLDDSAGKSCSETIDEISASKCQDDKMKKIVEGKANPSAGDLVTDATVGEVVPKDTVRNKTRRSPRQMLSALRKGNRVTAAAKKQKAICEKNTVDEDCYIVEKIDNKETIDLTESHHDENPLESSRESAGSLDSGIMSPPGFEHHLKENSAEKQQIFLPLKPLRRPLRLPKMMSDCQRTSVLEMESKKRTADHGIKQNVMESIKEICKSNISNNATETKIDTGTQKSLVDESDKENTGHRLSSGVRRTAITARRRLAKIQEKNDSKVGENTSPQKEEESASLLSNKARLEAENNVKLKGNMEDSSKTINTAVEKRIIMVTPDATTGIKMGEKTSSLPDRKNVTTITSDKEFYEKIWRKNERENVAAKEPSAGIKAEADVKPQTEGTPEKAATAAEDRKNITEESKSNEKTPLTKYATLEKNTQLTKPEHKSPVPPTNSEHENEVPQIQSQHESKVPQTNLKHENKVPQTNLKHENKVPQTNLKHENKVPQTNLKHENKVPQTNSEHENKVPQVQSEHENKAAQAKEEATKDDVALAASRSEKKATLQKQTRQLAQCVRDFLGEEKPAMQASYSRLGAIQAHWLKHSFGDISATFEFQLGKDLKFPIGVTTDREGNIIVTDTGNNLVKKFDCNGNVLTVMGNDMFSPLKRPSAVVVNGNNEVFVKDDACIHKFDSHGKFLMTIGKRVLSRPFGLDLTPAGNLITLTTNPRQPMLIQLSQDGERVFSFIYMPLLNAPYGSKCRFLAVSDNTVIVSDLGLSKIYLTNLEGLCLGEFGGYGPGPEDFLEPSGITVDSFGNVLIGDSKNNRIKMYRQNGTYIGLVQLDCSIVRPSGIHLTRDNRIIVVNFLLHHVKVFKLAN